MKIKLFLLLFLFVSLRLFSQEYVFGKITNDDDVELNDVTVINLNTDERTSSDRNGHYMIRASQGHELRFTKVGYERKPQKISESHFEKPLNVVLKQIPQEIEEVEIKYKPTGNLKEDVKHFGDRGKVKKMKEELADYVARKSDPIVLAPRRGEFVQPVGPGFSVGRVKDKWDEIDIVNFMMKEIDQDFFIDELKLTKSEISPFVFYVLRDFNKAKLIKYGEPKASDVADFVMACYQKINEYKRK